MSETAQTTRSMALDQRRLRLWLRMLRTTRQVEGRLRDFLRAEFNTTLPRFDVMAALEKSPQGLTMGEISEQLLVSNGNVTGIIERLVQEGLVLRVAVEGDRRAMRAVLTDLGRTEFERMAERHRAVIDDTFGTLNDESLDQLSLAFTTLKTIGD